jgi:HSP20 family protein
MNTVIRWNPYREMMAWRNLMDRMMDDSMGAQPSLTWELALDVVENKDEFVVKASLPGLNPDDLEITYDKNLLTIKGEIKDEQEIEETRYHLRERRYGVFTRSITLPVQVDAESIEARYESGVLTLSLPKSEEVRPKRIAVQNVQAPQMVEGKATEIAHKN